MVKASGILKRQVLILLVLFIAFFIFREAMHSKLLNDLLEVLSKGGVTKPVRYKCDLSKPCPEGHFAFKMHSGIASVVGPKLCLEDSILMSGVKNNIGQGMNVALVDGQTGQLIKTEVFNTWAGDVNMLIKFLKTIEDGTLVMMATFDDASTKLNAEARQLISNLGSLRIHLLGLRDNWVFVGRKGMSNQTSFEMYIKNDVGTNRYDGWPDFVEMEGCVGQGLDKASENN